MDYLPLHPSIEIETKAILRKAVLAHRALAELKGIVSSIPNENILIETLTLQEARESSAIENIISTFDDVYKSSLDANEFASPAAKEVHMYASALRKGFDLVKKTGLLTNNYILQIQRSVELNNAGFRTLPGTKLLNDITGEVVYTPPQDGEAILSLMKNLEAFINDDSMMDVDPLIKMAIIHHQFESIHPFYDGNGRTGRIINMLYLVQKDLLHLPILYMSRYIIKHKYDYYRLLQTARESNRWEEWIIFILTCVEETAKESVILISEFKKLMNEYKNEIRTRFPKIYSQDLINNLFKYPYTKIEFVEHDLQVSRSTAIRYLRTLVSAGFVIKQKFGKESFYLNHRLFELLRGN